jgi:hypothetical protein
VSAQRLVNLEATPMGPGIPNDSVTVNTYSVVSVEPYVGAWEIGGLWRALEVRLSGGHKVSVMDTPVNRQRLGVSNPTGRGDSQQ